MIYCRRDKDDYIIITQAFHGDKELRLSLAVKGDHADWAAAHVLKALMDEDEVTIYDEAVGEIFEDIAFDLFDEVLDDEECDECCRQCCCDGQEDEKLPFEDDDDRPARYRELGRMTPAELFEKFFGMDGVFR